jgi:hypothetical protein
MGDQTIQNHLTAQKDAEELLKTSLPGSTLKFS